MPLRGLAGPLWPSLHDEGISGSQGGQKRPGLDALLKGVARREFDIVAAWSVCRLGPSLPDLIGLLDVSATSVAVLNKFGRGC
jgi:DNA invertase Pin-like site-specific DNA recombinase